MPHMTAEEIYLEEVSVGCIIGDLGGRTVITGDIYRSNTFQGCISFETEHGTLYIDKDHIIEFE